ncbi:M20 metallopeptidase family protein [Pelosinus baikalensis]|uniref:Amidohydrolase n=1 Tax=Pelosinus baikalensis TaxID=2892015 RepID=A0ABS8HW53_9FIRM|nr:amidohydrolase [Pelosinus baikalensis]MCC5467392.1 amidohydrolase [Pelosinus baikalensis]
MWDHRQEIELQQIVTSLRQDFHRHPELSGKEKRTRETIETFLRNIGVTVQTFVSQYGLCGVIEGDQPGPIIALRADMDALPIIEENNVPYQSLYKGSMHACGHDGHMAILMGTAVMLMKHRHQLKGTVKLIFQPAEEAAPLGGATAMMQEGVLEDVDAIFGLHLWPDIPYGTIGIKSGAFMAASDRFTINILGRGAHAAQPHKGIDSITMSADIIQGFNHIISRQIDPLEVATISIGAIHGGERYNVIAKEVMVEGTIRTLNETTRQEIPRRMAAVLEGITKSQGGDYVFDYQQGYPALRNWTEPTEIVIQAATKVIGKNNICTDIKPVLGAEDFANYLTKIPGAFFFLGCAKAGEDTPILHNSRFDIDENALLIGSKLLYQIVLEVMKSYKAIGGEAY